MANIMVSPGGYSQIRGKKILLKSRGVSPTFKEVLRDRCHLRIKARRNSLLEQFRNMKGNDELRKTLSNMLHEEVNVLKAESEKPMDVEELPCSRSDCCQDNEDRWIIEEYEKVLADEEAAYDYDWDKEVICPLCKKAVLKQNNYSACCFNCKAEFPGVFSLQDFRDRLNIVLTQHPCNCDDVPQFAFINDGNSDSLFLICHSCGFFSCAV